MLFRSPEVLQLADRPRPVPKANEILVRVAAAGVNRPDVLQRTGNYPVPADASDLPGLEIAGEVVAKGDAVTLWKPGDKVCALVHGGGRPRVLPARRLGERADGALVSLGAGGVYRA